VLLKRYGLMLAVLASLCATGSASADVKVQTALPDGITLAPEEANADAVITAAPGQQVSATVRPRGCNSDACAAVITTSGLPPQRGNRPLVPPGRSGTVVPLNGAKVTATREGASTASAAMVRTRKHGPTARAAVTVNDPWGYVTDYMCSTGGCWMWKFFLSSHAYCDSSGWCWGTRSRYNYVGDIGCWGQGAGYSVTRDECGFHSDPSTQYLYASSTFTITAGVKGFPFGNSKYLHRHYVALGSWLVSGT
jgi:hypothetical protein